MLYLLYSNSSNDSNNYNKDIFYSDTFNIFNENYVFNKNFNDVLLYYNLLNNDMNFLLDPELLSKPLPFNSNVNEHFELFNDISDYDILNYDILNYNIPNSDIFNFELLNDISY